VAFIIRRPAPGTPLFWFLLVPAFLSGIGSIWRQRLDSCAEQHAWQRWDKRLRVLNPLMDIEDDGHLYEWLDPEDWELVFGELERMPADSRSLKHAMSLVNPEVP